MSSIHRCSQIKKHINMFSNFFYFPQRSLLHRRSADFLNTFLKTAVFAQGSSGLFGYCSDVVRTLFWCCSDCVRMCSDVVRNLFGCCSNVVRILFGCCSATHTHIHTRAHTHTHTHTLTLFLNSSELGSRRIIRI